MTLGAALSSSAAAQDTFDGTWAIEIVAESGECQPRTVAIEVMDGKVMFVGFGATAEGEVRSNGRVNAALVRGEMVVTARGALEEEIGSGHWRSEDCRGSWTARRY